MTEQETERWRRRAEREKQTRIEAERVAEQATRELYLANEALAGANAALERRSRSLYQELFDRNPLPSMLIDAASLQFLEINHAAKLVYGLTDDDRQTTTLAAIQANDLDTIRTLYSDQQSPVSLRCTHYGRNGEPLEIILSVHTVAWGDRAALLLVAQDVTRSERDHRELEQRTQAMEASQNGVFICDLDAFGQPLTYLNAAVERLSDIDRGRVLGHPWTDLFADAITGDPRTLLSEGHALREEIRISDRDGRAQWVDLQITPITLAGGESRRAVGVIIDINQRKAFESQLMHLAHHDTLTQLPNRKLLEQTLACELQRAASAGEKVIVLFIDFDKFKQINDLGGHAAGDTYLKILAARLSERASTTDMLARVGGDEFVMVSAAANARTAMPRLIRRLRHAFLRPVEVNGKVFPARCSMGAAIYPKDGLDPETLLRRADIAMYYAKAKGGGRFSAFKPDMEQRYLGRSALEQALERAIHAGEFAVFYQPQVDLETGRVLSVEALLRWPTGPANLNTPDIFIPIAEETNLIEPLGNFVLERACKDIAALRAAHHDTLSVGVNLSAVQLADPDLPQKIARLLDQAGLPGEALELEITESALMTDPEQSAEILARLRKLNVTIAIDDFGTGYSNLSYLRHLPAQRLKIDRGFIADMSRSRRALGLVRAIFDLGSHLDLTPIAEGIETEDNRRQLIELGCRVGQGFYFSRAVDYAGLSQRLRQRFIAPWTT